MLGHEYGADVALGIGEKPGLDLLHHEFADTTENPFTARAPYRRRRATSPSSGTAGRGDQELRTCRCGSTPTPGSTATTRSRSARRTIDAVHTPGHTPGHYVFADRADGLLFAGDHVLPTITPSIGFTVPPTPTRSATSWPR